MPELKNPKYEQFAQLTAEGMNRGPAYEAAGFQCKNALQFRKGGVRLYARPEVRARCIEIEDDVRISALKQSRVCRELVIQGILDNIGKAAQEVPVLDRQGKKTGEYTMNYAAVNKGWELLGKEIGMFADKLIMQNLDTELEGKSDTELREYVKAMASEVGLRVVESTDDELRKFILKHAGRLGLRVVDEGRKDSAGTEATPDSDLPAVPEASTLPSTRLN